MSPCFKSLWMQIVLIENAFRTNVRRPFESALSNCFPLDESPTRLRSWRPRRNPNDFVVFEVNREDHSRIDVGASPFPATTLETHTDDEV
jgi:hypothetical protein